ncbi:hypothetical protein PVAP13_7KG121921 [Panicum virgatum]|uniref:Uncharacterized protein n=1 Tax=Panicum virgatum TaxID=38727 RepID=A0A8T0QAE4_PANVG|nr:hypothetical protein PVAP13_7KG121921 [Panicum virgatum]
MTKTQYELDRDERVRDIEEHFKSLGIPILPQEVRDVISKKEKCKRKTVVSDNSDSDKEYDPSSDIDNQSESDDDLNNEDNTEVGAMVPGTRPQQKKQKMAQMAAAKQLPPRTSTRLTRQHAAMPSPGGRPPPRERLPLPPNTSSKANPKTNPISSASKLPSPSRLPSTSQPVSAPGGNTEHSTPTPTTSVNQSDPIETSPGVQSSRQSNDINDSNVQVDADLEGPTNEGEPVGDLVLAPRKEVCKKTIGVGLEKMIKRGNKLAIQVAEGKKRPDVPLQAAKLASETGVALRDKLPIYTSWKLYERDGGPAEVQKVLDKVANRLDVDVKNEGPSKSACTDIIKKGVRQQRYHLKRKYFDESLIKEQLLAKEPPRKMKKEEWIKLRPKYNNSEPDAVDFFGECMNKKNREPEEGEAQKSPSKIVDESLSQISRSSTFLPNIGAPRPSKTGQSSSTAAQARMQAQFEAALQAEREESARKQEELKAQLQTQQAALEENQSLLRQTQEQVRGMTIKFEETNELLRAVLKFQKE